MAAQKKKKYTALRRLTFISGVIESGEPVELTDRQAKYLLLDSKIEPVVKKTRKQAKEK